jgi:protein-tyrosine-phosphatase
MGRPAIVERARIHAALGDPGRLAIVEDLWVSDRSPKELSARLGMPSNLLAHHLDVLEAAGAIERSASAGDARRRYVRLRPGVARVAGPPDIAIKREVLFLCTHNSARSQIAAALWCSRTGRKAASAGTRPAQRVHPGAVAAARRAGLSMTGAKPTAVDSIPRGVQVITVCDLVHEELDAATDWWHWSIPDPVTTGRAARFDAVVGDIEQRIARIQEGISR